MLVSDCPSTGSISSAPNLRQRARRDFAFIKALLDNPLETLPPSVFTEPLVRAATLGRKLVYVMAPELVQEALNGASDRLDKGESYRRPLRAALGEGLLTAEAEEWRWQRRAIAPVFRAAGLERFLPAMIARAEAARDRLLALSGDVVINHETMRLTFAIIVDAILSGTEGFDVDEVEVGLSEYVRLSRWSNLAAAVKAPGWVPYPGKRRSLALARRLRHQVQARVAARRVDAVRCSDLTDLLLQASDPETGRHMTDGEITDNLLTFLTAGHETTALGLAWTLDLLGRHPEIAARVRAEIDTVTGGGPVRPAHIDGLHYTRQAFQEALRLYPPAPLIPRQVTQSFELGGERLESGAIVLIPVYAIHRHKLIWDAPHVFDPERFHPDRVARRHRYAFMPFGVGPRTCIGSGFAMMEAVAILAVLLQRLRLTPSQPAPPKPRMEITLRPSEPLLMSVQATAWSAQLVAEDVREHNSTTRRAVSAEG